MDPADADKYYFDPLDCTKVCVTKCDSAPDTATTARLSLIAGPPEDVVPVSLPYNTYRGGLEQISS